MARQISGTRTGAYYLGMAMSAVGLLLVLSTIAGIWTTASDPFLFAARPPMFRGFVGFVLVLTGEMLRKAGARGLAGAGLILDPERARDDLEPYSRMAGGMVQDALEEAQVEVARRPEAVVKIKCRSCAALNEEDSKFCRACGVAL